MVVVVEPGVKGCGPFGAVAVERAVGPAAEQGADEALGFAVGLRPVGPGAQVADAEGAARDGVDGGAVGRAVVGDQPLDGDAVAAVERDRAAQEADRGRGLLVAEDLDIGQASAVVDSDVDELPAGVADASAVGGVGVAGGALAAGGRGAGGGGGGPARAFLGR